MSPQISILPTGVLESLLIRLDDDQPNSGHAVAHGLRFLRLPHPRTGIPSLFLPYHTPGTGKISILELQQISPPNQRSWFMPENEIIGNGNLLLLTPIDPALLLIPILQLTHPIDGSLGTFRPADELYEEATSSFLEAGSENVDDKDPSSCMSPGDLNRFWSLDCTQKAMHRICEVKDITPDIVVCRFSTTRVVSYLRDKVMRLARPEIFEGSQTLTRGLAKDGFLEDGKEHLLDGARIRAACELVSQYISKNMYDTLVHSFDLSAVDAYLEAAAARQTASASSRMANAEAKESATTNTQGNSKKRKNPRGSQGVEKLKKVNVKGMAKISSFFPTKSS